MQKRPTISATGAGLSRRGWSSGWLPMRRWLSALAAVGLAAASVALGAATPEEVQAHDRVVKMFQDGLYDKAEAEAQAFRQAFAQSERLPEVGLIQAQSRLRLKNYDGALALLAEGAPNAGALADEYGFWQAEVLYQKGDLAPAAEAFAKAAASFPQSPRRLQAAYSEAFARAKLGQTDEAIRRLREPDAPFQQAAQAKPDDEHAIRGHLLLAELLWHQRDTDGAVDVLERTAKPGLAPTWEWQRRYLLAQAQFAAGKTGEALKHATNLWTLPADGVSPELQAAAALLQAEVFEREGQPEAAQQAYDRCLKPELPAAQRRLALEKSVALSLSRNRLNEATQRLENLTRQSPNDPLTDLVRVLLGELRLRELYEARRSPTAATPEGAALVTNLLTQARTHLDLVVTNFAQSPLLGRAQLSRGWVFWEEGTNRLVESRLAFKAAAELLSNSNDRVVARFKWADCQLRLGDFGGALTNYWLVATNPPTPGGATHPLQTQALYQVVRTAIEANNLEGATAAMRQLLDTDPDGTLADRSELLVGQALNRSGKPQAARAIYADFVNRFPNSPLLPEVRLALGKTYEQDYNWREAVTVYTQWLNAYSNQPTVPRPMVAQACFDLARVSYQSAPDTNSLGLLTSFLTSFPDSTNAPLARYLVGEYYFSQGDYGRAELQFQNRDLVQNPNAILSELTYRARLMAGRAAIARQSYRSARDHFDWVITNGPLHVAQSPIPVSVVAEAYLFRGDTFTLEPADAEANALARFGEAINAFSKITEHFPTNEFAPLAWGRIGECHFQLASKDPKRYDAAADAFRRVIESSADVSVRSQAEWKLAVVLERQAQLRPAAERPLLENQAFDLYLRVLYGKNLRPGETADPLWVKRAGISAAELAESQKNLDTALGLYQRLLQEVPSLRNRLEKKIEELQAARAKSPS